MLILCVKNDINLEENIMKKILLFVLLTITVGFNMSASEVEDTDNLVTNGDFENTESVPTSPDESTGTWVNTGIWENDVKPKNWDYQKWKNDQATEKFHAEVLTDSEVSGENAVKLTVNESDSNTQAFFKQTKIAVEGNRAYDLSFSSKLDNIVGSNAVIRVEEFDQAANKINSTDFTIGTGSSEWTKQDFELNTLEGTKTVNLVFVIPSNTTGSVGIDNVSLVKEKPELTGLTLDNESLDLSSTNQKQLNVSYEPKDTGDTDVVWTTSDESVATVDNNGLVTAVAPGEATITVTSSVNSEISAKCIITVVDGDILVDNIQIVGDDVQIETGKKRFLDYTTSPATAVNSDLPVTWSSSDESIFTVNPDDGLITGVSPGVATLTLASSENPDINSTLDITVVADETDEQFTLMEERWKKRIIGDENLNLDNEYIANYVKKTSDEAQTLWDEMDKSTDRTYLWPLADGDTASADITTQFKKINTLALAFGMEGSDLQGNRDLYFDILDALDFMTTEKSYDGTTVTENWWDCQIGAAQKFTDTLMIMEEYMPTELVQQYATIISGYASDPSLAINGGVATGANTTDIGISVLGTAILLEDPNKMELIDETIPVTFELVTTGDGLYADGSVIQHNIFAYSGSYGNELLKGIGRILEIIAGTEWEIKDDSINNVYDTILNGYIPLMSDGRMMSMVSGRSVSRPSGTEYATGASTIANVMVIANFAPEPYATTFKENVKQWISSEQETFNFFANARDLEALQNADDIMNDDSIEAKSTYTGTKVYSMDKAVQVADDYSVGISMYSDRTGNYELQTQGSGDNTKYENTQGWHQSDGVMYLYNNDYDAYDQGYWATIDSKLLPGTTVSTSDLLIGEGKGATSDQSWVGGASDGNVGAVGMQLDKSNTGTDLAAKKSWFLLDGAVVALGSDIDGTSDDTIQTVVDNRKIGTGSDRSGDSQVIINGDISDGTEETSDYSAGSWMNIGGNGDDSSIGYYFPEDTNITTLAETNTESFESINTLFVDNKEYTDEYQKILINHGSEVDNGSYEYYVLPGKTAKQTEQFANNNNIEVLRNDDSVQAVVDRDNNVFAMNVWNPSGISSKYISVDKPSSVIAEISDGSLNVTISDPTREQGQINIELDNNIDLQSLSLENDNIDVSSDLHNLQYNSPADGSSSTVSFKVPKMLDFSTLNDDIKTAEAIDQSLYTPRTVAVLNDKLAVAQDVSENATDQESIDKAAKELEGAIDGLVKLADKAALKQLLTDSQDLKESDYTKDSYKVLEKSQTNAEQVIDDENASQGEVDNAYDDLQLSIDQLVLSDSGNSNSEVDSNSEIGSNSEVDNNSDSGSEVNSDENNVSNLNNTGGSAYLIPVGVVGLGLIMLLKRSMKN